MFCIYLPFYLIHHSFLFECLSEIQLSLMFFVDVEENERRDSERCKKLHSFDRSEGAYSLFA